MRKTPVLWMYTYRHMCICTWTHTTTQTHVHVHSTLCPVSSSDPPVFTPSPSVGLWHTSFYVASGKPNSGSHAGNSKCFIHWATSPTLHCYHWSVCLNVWVWMCVNECVWMCISECMCECECVRVHTHSLHYVWGQGTTCSISLSTSTQVPGITVSALHLGFYPLSYVTTLYVLSFFLFERVFYYVTLAGLELTKACTTR